MKVERTTYPGWHQHPVYRCDNSADYDTVKTWAQLNGCYSSGTSFLLSGGYTGYVFQVASNPEWFALRWGA